MARAPDSHLLHPKAEIVVGLKLQRDPGGLAVQDVPGCQPQRVVDCRQHTAFSHLASLADERHDLQMPACVSTRRKGFSVADATVRDLPSQVPYSLMLGLLQTAWRRRQGQRGAFAGMDAHRDGKLTSEMPTASGRSRIGSTACWLRPEAALIAACT